MRGFPCSPHYGIAQVAEWCLRQSLAEDFEVTNLAMTGASVAVAAAELKKLDRQPDVLVVYSGHNEFFHKLFELGLTRNVNFGQIDELLCYSATFRILNTFLLQSQIGLSRPDSHDLLIGPWLGPEFIL